MSKTVIVLLASAGLLALSGSVGVIRAATAAMSWITLAAGAGCAAIILIAWLQARFRSR
jgi:hypothetical protein